MNFYTTPQYELRCSDIQKYFISTSLYQPLPPDERGLPLLPDEDEGELLRPESGRLLDPPDELSLEGGE